jgi:hypothetical protein
MAAGNAELGTRGRETHRGGRAAFPGLFALVAALVIGAGVLGLLALGLAGWDRGWGPLRAAWSGWVSVEDVAENPGSYMGRALTVRGRIEAALGPRSFVLTDRVMPDEHELLLLTTAELAPATAAEGGEVIVWGTVRRFEEVEPALVAGLPAPQRWAGRLAIIADSVSHVP